MGAHLDREKKARKIKKGDKWHRGEKSVTFVKWLGRNGPRTSHPMLVVKHSNGDFDAISLVQFVKKYRPPT